MTAAQGFDDRAEPAQATPAGGVAEEVPHDGRASATLPPSATTPRAWEKQEAGWYTSDLGGICHEHDGWAFWPNNVEWPAIRGLPTMGAAIAEAERLARVRGAACAMPP